ncbi:MAG: sulfatase [Deltaproteobacteria bacterium]|nr:sulfatase [Deltaproteobacteria bacterium]MBW2444684.1 sulfatase [Deltaproteobacteria bacterium]
MGEPRKVALAKAALAVGLLAVAGVLLWAQVVRIVPAAAPERARVLLLTVDTLRADHVGSAPHGPKNTPFLDSLLAHAQVFERAVTPLPRTTPAVASLLTGSYPHTTQVRSLADPLAPEIVSVAELFRARGYRTVAVVSNHVLRPRRGLGRGFDVYDYAGDARDGEATTRAALAHLAEIGPEEAVFLWVHYIDPHVPYAPGAELARRFDPGYEGRYREHFGGEPGATGPSAFPTDLPKREAIYRNPLPDAVTGHVRKLYAADVHATDMAIESLMGGLDHAGGPWSVVFTSDHGESLGEHDYFWEHGDYVWNETVRVPLAFVFAPGDPLHGQRRVEPWVSLVDVMPTLVELFDLPMPYDLAYEVEGRSLVPALRGEPLPVRGVFAESGRSHHPEEIRGRLRFDVAGRFRTVLRGRWKLVWTPFQEPGREFALFDLELDPGEARNLYRPDHPVGLELRRELSAWLREPDGRTAVTLDATDQALLRSLGYIE